MTKSFQQEGSAKYVYRTIATINHGWTVKVYDANRLPTKLFTDNEYGSRENSLIAALEHRDSILVLKKRRLVSGHTALRADNKSGTVGVFHEKVCGRPYWTAECFLGIGRRKIKRFSINKLGEELARHNAEQYRQEQLNSVKQTVENEDALSY